MPKKVSNPEPADGAESLSLETAQRPGEGSRSWRSTGKSKMWLVYGEILYIMGCVSHINWCRISQPSTVAAILRLNSNLTILGVTILPYMGSEEDFAKSSTVTSQ